MLVVFKRLTADVAGAVLELARIIVSTLNTRKTVPADVAAPEDPEDAKQKTPQSNRNSTPQNRNSASTSQQHKTDNQKSNQSDENRRLLGRGLRLR